MKFDDSKSFSEDSIEKELENNVIKRDDFVESDVITEVAVNELAKLKPKGVLRSKVTTEKIESQEASFEEEKITLLDIKRKRSRKALNDENPDERSVKRFKTEEKVQENNNDQWMQRSTARALRKIKSVNAAFNDVIVSEVENKKVGGIKRVYNRKAKEDGSKSKEMSVEKPKKENLRSASTKATSRIKSRESKSTTKQKITAQMKSLLLNAGWKIEFRPRNGRDYHDSVYIPPSGGGAFWSITKAYNVYLKQDETEETVSACVMVPPDQVNMLTRVVVNKRVSGKNKTSEKNKQGLKIRKARNDVCKPRKKRGTGMSIHDAKKDEDDDGYKPYNWKCSILSWMIDMGVIKGDGEVNYMNKEKSQALLEGSITRDGILCGCCNETVCVSTFEIHAGSKLNQPYENIVLEKKRVSLHDCQVNAWEKQKVSEKQDFYEVDISGDGNSDDTCGICGDGGDLVCCDGCPSTFHLNCLDMEILPPDDWRCTNCSCRYCNSVSTVDLNDGPVISLLVTCVQCEKKYHRKCIPPEESITITSKDADASFCGKSCKKVFEQLLKLIGTKNELESGLSWSVYHHFRDYSSEHDLSMRKKVESNSKVAVALTVMDECFCPFIDHRTGVNLIHHVVYNCGSNIPRLSYSGFYTFVLERGDEILAVASVRIHGTRLAEMPFIGTRNMYRRQGMCRQLLNGIESALCSLNVEKLIIPAISELTKIWTGSFGFNHLTHLERQEAKSTKIIAFKGTGLLHKPIVSKSSSNGNSSPIGDILILPKVDDQNEHGEKTVNVSTCNNPETSSKKPVMLESSSNGNPSHIGDGQSEHPEKTVNANACNELDTDSKGSQDQGSPESLAAEGITVTERKKSYRSSLTMFYKFMESIKENLTTKHLTILEETPFFDFINLFLENKIDKSCFQKATNCLDALLETYNPNSGFFEMNGLSLKLKQNDISKIYGFPTKNLETKELQKMERKHLPTDCARFVDKYLGENDKMGKNLIVRAVRKLLKKKDAASCKDAVIFILLHLMCTLFFANSNYVVRNSLLPLIINFDSMRKTNWSKLILQHLEWRMGTHYENPRKNDACVTILLHWFCDIKISVIEAREEYKEGMPTVCKWQVNKLNDVLTSDFLTKSGQKKALEVNERLLLRSPSPETKDALIQNLQKENHDLKAQIDQLRKENEELRKRYEKKTKRPRPPAILKPQAAAPLQSPVRMRAQRDMKPSKKRRKLMRK